jgi:probable F420-dependent oxidoreductase
MSSPSFTFENEVIMNVGLTLSVTERVPDVVWIARQAEALGFDSIWVAEHPAIPVNYGHFPNAADGRVPELWAHWPDPFVSLAAAAAVTSRVKLATGICLIPERDPIVTAKVVASLDRLSQGRVILGVGGGALKEETEIMGTAFGRRWKRLRENIEAMKELWTKEEAGYNGELVRFPPLRSYPKPYQKPHPPVLLGAHGPKALTRVARYCEGWVPFGVSPDDARRAIAAIRRIASDFGRQLDSPDVTIMTGLDGFTVELLQRYRDAGVNRVVVPLPQLPRQLTQMAEIVEHGQSI